MKLAKGGSAKIKLPIRHCKNGKANYADADNADADNADADNADADNADFGPLQFSPVSQQSTLLAKEYFH